MKLIDDIWEFLKSIPWFGSRSDRRDDFKTLTEQYESFTALVRQELGRLSEKVEVLETENAELKRQIGELARENSSLKIENGSLKTESDALRKRVEELENESRVRFE